MESLSAAIACAHYPQRRFGQAVPPLSAMNKSRPQGRVVPPWRAIEWGAHAGERTCWAQGRGQVFNFHQKRRWTLTVLVHQGFLGKFLGDGLPVLSDLVPLPYKRATAADEC